MTKKNVGMFVLIYLLINVIVSYKTGVFKRTKELVDYELAHPEEPRKSMSEILNYAFNG